MIVRWSIVLDPVKYFKRKAFIWLRLWLSMAFRKDILDFGRLLASWKHRPNLTSRLSSHFCEVDFMAQYRWLYYIIVFSLTSKVRFSTGTLKNQALTHYLWIDLNAVFLHLIRCCFLIRLIWVSTPIIPLLKAFKFSLSSNGTLLPWQRFL